METNKILREWSKNHDQKWVLRKQASALLEKIVGHPVSFKVGNMVDEGVATVLGTNGWGDRVRILNLRTNKTRWIGAEYIRRVLLDPEES